MKPVGFLLATLLALPLWAAPPAVNIPAEVRPAGQYVTLSPQTDAAAITYIGLSGIDPLPAAMLKDARMFLLDTRGLAVGRYQFVAVASLQDEHTRVDFSVVIGTPPVVVVPPPGPGPVNPQPPVSPIAGMRVLTIWESDTPLPKDWNDSLTSTEVIDYLNQKCLKGPDGKTPERRTFDEDVSLSQLPKPWQDLRSALPDELPFVHSGMHQIPHVAIGDSSGVVVHRGPYPRSDVEALSLFKKFGGP